MTNNEELRAKTLVKEIWEDITPLNQQSALQLERYLERALSDAVYQATNKMADAITTFQQEAIEREALADRLKAGLVYYRDAHKTDIGVDTQGVIATAALSQSPPPSFGSRVLELSKTAYELQDCFSLDALAELQEKAAALTPEDIKWLGE